MADEPADPWTALDQEARTAAVNEGSLRLLTADAAAEAHVHENRVTIAPQSLGDGWVGLGQCHRDLAPVPSAEVVFQPGRIRNLQVTRSDGIGRALVGGHLVRGEDVGPDARLCIRAESLALHDLGDGRFRLRTGPSMRRSLDCYYPMRMALRVEHPAALHLMGQYPQPQSGVNVTAVEGRVDLEATFEGDSPPGSTFAPRAREPAPPFALPCDPTDGEVPREARSRRERRRLRVPCHDPCPP